ncbi:MAG: Ppx/GppA family phosphatase [Deltaproteobacteria bacterium]|nr:Ppx/GppA family phosphatase [Deltaproteobacteria bacterium]
MDVGSNTLRLLIARAGPGPKLATVCLERAITRLSQNLAPGRPLHGPARDRSLKVLVRFGETIARHGVGQVFGGATAAVRLASDGDHFLDLVARQSGLKLKKLDGQEEARLTALGLASGLPDGRGPVLAIDPGGQSTEFIPIEAGQPRPGLSLNLGVVALTEKVMVSNPPQAGQMTGLKAEIKKKLEEVTAFYPPRKGLTLAGTAGTVTTIAAMILEMTDYDPATITGLNIGLSDLKRLVSRLEKMSLEERRRLPGLETGREDVILPGLVLVQSLLEVYSLTKIVAIDSGLLEGFIIDGLGLAQDRPE